MTTGTQAKAQELEAWLRASSSIYVHPSLRFVYDEQNGVHWRATDTIDLRVNLISVPHSYCLSYLNALVDDAYPVFKAKRQQFSVEAIGFFYLMLQYVNRNTSFWQPYLESLPPPDSCQLSTPLWFDEDEDIAWLQRTDVAETMAKRKLVYEKYYASGCEILAESGIDVSQLSWDLFRWSITMFTSRSFPSSSIAPQDSKYWAAFKNGPRGARQTVLLDMSHTAAEDLDFSVLFPGIDTGNHNHECEANWSFDPGRFTFALSQQIDAGEQIFNNYGPKPNHELLQGYGFTIQPNPYETVLLTLKAPSQDLQASLRSTHAGYFSTGGVWLPDKATFGLKLLADEDGSPEKVLGQLPIALLELLILIVRNGQGHDFDVSAHRQIDLRSVEWQRYLPHAVRMLSDSLTSKYSILANTTPAGEPKNRKQIYAKAYRDGQLRILESYLRSFTAYMTFLEWHTSSSKELPIRLAVIDDILGSLAVHAPKHHTHFLAGISANANSSDIDVLRDAGWEDDMWVLLLCFICLLSEIDGAGEPFGRWISCLVTEYQKAAQPPTGNSAPVEQIEGLLEIVHIASQAVPESIWANDRWTTGFIAGTGARMFSSESFMLGNTERRASSAPRVAVLWFNA